jgi:putative transcriptional regulator
LYAPTVLSQAPARQLPLNKGVFLVATSNLDNSSFRQTVILLSSYSAQGASGLAINRPSELSIHDAFPDQPRFAGDDAMMHLGGPVHTDAVFVLMKTQRPHAGMLHVLKDVYMASTLSALQHGASRKVEGEKARAYAGYSGWAPGQLDVEVKRGDWLVIHADTAIIFSAETDMIWEQLFNTWSGQWI